MKFFIWLINSGVLMSLHLPDFSSSLTDSLPCFWISYATQKLMLDSSKMVEKQSEAFITFLWHHFSKFRTEIIAYRSSKVFSHPDCIFEIHQLWQSGFSRVYSNSCCSCSFEPRNHKNWSVYTMYSNNILHFQESTTILNAFTKKSGNLLKVPSIY